MSKMALHIEHYKRGAVGSIAGHNWYKRGDRDEHSNQDIDPARSKDNIALVLPEEGTFYQDVKATVEQATGRVTAASVWVSEWILYPPEDLQDPLTADKDKIHRYYSDALDWMRDQGYPVKLAAIHMDESTVHAHIDTVPLTEDGRLSRKDVYTRSAMSAIHTGLAKYLADKGWDIQRGESTKGKGVSAKTVKAYKAEAEKEKLRLQAELDTLKEQADQARQKAKELDQQIDMAEIRLSGAETAESAATSLAEAARLEAEAAQEQARRAMQEAAQARQTVQEYRDRIREQEDTLQLIQDYDTYLQEADAIDKDIDLLEEAVRELPAAAQHYADTATWMTRIHQLLQNLLRMIEATIKRLQIYERTHDVEVRHSEPAQQRAAALGDMIASAEGRACGGRQKGGKEHGLER